MDENCNPPAAKQRWGGHIIGTLAARWPEFVDCDARLRSEIPFLKALMGRFYNPKILDAAMGIGCEVIWLTKEGHDVVGNEIEDDLLIVARSRAAKSGVEIVTTSSDWRNISATLGKDRFDLILLLGNSLSLLRDRADRESAAEQLYLTCKNDGLAIVDERNFSYIHSNRDSILDGNFRYSRSVVYCGRTIDGRPIDIEDNYVRFSYFDGERTIGTLDMYPFAPGELRELFLRVGFTPIATLSDLQAEYRGDADFYTYIFKK
jgi:hypothetical protein